MATEEYCVVCESTENLVESETLKFLGTDGKLCLVCQVEIEGDTDEF